MKEETRELLRVEHLKKYFPTPRGLLYAVDRAQYRGTDPVRWFETRSWPVRELLLAGLILLTFFLGIWGNGFHGSGFIYAQF